MKTVLVMIAMTLSFSMAQAQTPAAPAAPTAPAAGQEHPCKKIMESCTAAGFKKGGYKEGKGLFKDCMQPIMEGKTVAGVTASPADIEACKAHKEDHKAEMHH